MASVPKIRYGPKPTTAGQQQVVIRDYGGFLVYDSQPPSIEEDDPPTSEQARAHGLRRINRRHFAEHVATEHERLRSAVVEAAKAHRKAELNYWAKLPHERPASLFTKMENARIRLIGAVDALNAFEASRSIGQKDGEW